MPKILILTLFSLAHSLCFVANAEKTNDVAVLIDRSLSLEPGNRDEALRLISGILENKIPADLLEKWRFVPNLTHLNNPDTLAYRQKLQKDLAATTQNQSGEFHIPSPRLLLGSIGDLSTVLELQDGNWKSLPPSSIVDYGELASPSDKETHYELGRAIISSKLKGGEKYLLFVVSDGIEDLVDRPVSDYLDAKKLDDTESLKSMKFQDTVKMGLLQKRNAARKRGEDVSWNRSSSIRPGYSQQQQTVLRNHRESYDEMLIGKFALKPDELKAFFSTNTKKVPVFVEVYRNSPRPNLEVSFENPASSSLESPTRWLRETPPSRGSLKPRNDTITGCEPGHRKNLSRRLQ